jgi:peptide/nickel transport system ATP-binding protein
MTSPAPLLNVQDLTVAYRQGNTWLEAVRDVNLLIYPGQTYGLVGESGSGKTTLALSIMRYLGANGRVVKGAISLGGDDLCACTPKEMTQVWG